MKRKHENLSIYDFRGRNILSPKLTKNQFHRNTHEHLNYFILLILQVVDTFTLIVCKPTVFGLTNYLLAVNAIVSRK